MKKIFTFFGFMIICIIFSTYASAQVAQPVEMNIVQTDLSSYNTDKAVARNMCTVLITVVDDLGDPIMGANITVKGTSIGAITDFNGEARLNINCPCTIVISFIGFEPAEIYISGTNSYHTIKVVMRPEGYGNI